jgi:hypothetical protein
MFFVPDINQTELTTLELSNATRCNVVQQVANEKHVPRDFLNLLVLTEGGKIGSKTRNSNGSYDLGPAQINTIHAEMISQYYPNVNWAMLATEPYINISVSATIFKQCLNNSQYSVWEAVGCYNSKTVNIKTGYLYIAMRKWDRMQTRPELNCQKYWSG